MAFKLIDNSWKRYSVFNNYIEKLPNMINMTCNIDITEFLFFVKSQGYRFYPCFMWEVSKIINSHEEFKLGWNDKKEVGIYDTIHPCFTHFFKDDEICKTFVVKHDDNLKHFHENFVNIIKNKDNSTDLNKETTPKNIFNVSCIPWISYESFSIQIFDDKKYLAPIITWGKYQEKAGRIILPFSFQINHASADGFHLSRFFIELQEQMNSYKN